MATFRLRKFSHPDALKAISPARLVKFLRPYEGYFAARAVALPEDGDLDYEQIVSVLMNPDEDVPATMVEALYFVHEMADNDVMEGLLAAARTRHLELDLGEEPTAADVAVAVWLVAPDLLQEMHAESYVARPKSFEYYSGATRRRRSFPQHKKEKLAEIAERLDIWFIEHKRGDGTKVFVFPHGEKVFLLIRHGATMWREGSIKKGERGVAYYRPEVHDVLVYDTTMDLLGLKAGTKGEKTLYREVIGGMLFGSPRYFAERFELSLEPLRERGPEVLACEDVAGMNSVTLIEVRRFLGGEAKERQINQATDLFKAFGDRWPQRLGFGKLVGATFEVTLGQGQAARTRKVAISPPNFAKYDRDDDDADIIEMWLRRRELMPEPDEEDNAVPSVETPLADPGRAAAEDYRAPGLAPASG
jgi:hypothetical protein